MDSFNFEQLPELCQRKIFAFLNVQDLVKCRAVNRQFKSYADDTQVTELVVGDDKYLLASYGRIAIWFQTEREIDFQGAISPKALVSAKSSPFKLHQQLKFLYIRTRYAAFDFKILNDLKQLVHLEFHSWSFTKQTLALLNLKVLILRCGGSPVLNTPKLEVLRCDMIGNIELKYPQTIKRLECERVHFNFNHPNLAKLSNLEALGCSLDEAELNEVPGRLSNWTSLKELHLEFDFKCGNCERESDHERIRGSLTRILQKRASLKRDDLKITLNDMLLIDEKHLPNLEAYIRPDHVKRKCDLEEWINSVDTPFRLMNYKLIYYTDFRVNEVDFSELAELNFEISEDFFERFPRIRRVIAKNPVDREMFEWFLQNATELRELELSHSNLEQAFFDRLPKLASRLTRLTVYEAFGLVTDFQFLLHLKQLEEFDGDRAFHSFDLAATIFRESHTLKSFWLNARNECLQIKRDSAAEDNYSLKFFAREDNEDNESVAQTFGRENLRWSELVTLYNSRRTSFSASKHAMRVKRIRLE